MSDKQLQSRTQYGRKEKPEPPEGSAWERLDRGLTATIERSETKPYQTCPNCGRGQYRMVFKYRGGFISFHQGAWWECRECEYTEEIETQSGVVEPFARWFDE